MEDVVVSYENHGLLELYLQEWILLSELPQAFVLLSVFDESPLDIRQRPQCLHRVLVELLSFQLLAFTYLIS